jgi:hypothetical protein
MHAPMLFQSKSPLVWAAHFLPLTSRPDKMDLACESLVQ